MVIRRSLGLLSPLPAPHDIAASIAHTFDGLICCGEWRHHFPPFGNQAVAQDACDWLNGHPDNDRHEFKVFQFGDRQWAIKRREIFR